MFHRSLLLLMTCLMIPTVTTAAEKPSATVLTLRSAGAVPPPVQKRFDQKLREAVKAYATVGEPAAADKAVEGRCADAACLKKAAAAGKTRFAISGEVSNADDIYKVSLTLYDAAHDKVTDAAQECELCAAEEVDRSIVTAVDLFKAAFATPVPPPVADAPKAPPTTELIVTSDPTGADVAIDGKPLGRTPAKGQVTRGKHKLTLTKAGYVNETRDLEVGERAQTQEFLLQVVAVPVAAAPASDAGTGGEVEAAPVAAPRSHTMAGVILSVVGAVALGTGSYFINLDGKVTCPDKGRKECPDVYTTKWVGAAAMTIGGLALGSGVTLLVLPKIDAAPAPAGPSAEASRRLTTGLTFSGAF